MATVLFICILCGFISFLVRRIAIYFWGSRVLIWLEKKGVIWTDFSLGCEVTTLNSTFSGLGNPRNPRFKRVLDVWFIAGAVFGPCAQVLANLLLLWNLATTINVFIRDGSVSKAVAASFIRPMTPDSSDSIELILFWLAACVAFAVHEFGHALSATRQQLRVYRSGVFATCLFPGMYVKIEDLLVYTPAASQLIVFAAGVWHNFVLCLLCYFILHGGFKPFTALLYSKGNGVVVSKVMSNGPMINTLEPADIIISVDDHPVANIQDLLNILMHMTDNHKSDSRVNRGFCISRDAFQENLHSDSTLIFDCCDVLLHTGQYDIGETRHCYVTRNQTLDYDQSNPNLKLASMEGDPWYLYGCHNTSKQSKELFSSGMCRNNNDCKVNTQESICIRPLSSSQDFLVEIVVKRHDTNFNFLFEGEIQALLNAIEITDYTPRDYLKYFLPWLVKFFASLPPIVENFLWVLFQISSSMAIANSASIMYLDGEHIARQALRLLRNTEGSYRLTGEAYTEGDYAAKLVVRLTTGILIMDLLLCFVNIFLESVT